MFMNYQTLMEAEINKIQQQQLRPTLLLHVCCAPCSSAVLERLASFFHITLYYYNPNITPKSEYQKRIAELYELLKAVPYAEVEVLEGNYEPDLFFSKIRGLENEPEGGKRCYICYTLRLEKTAQLARTLQYDYFTTTLSISPYKNANWLNEIGKKMEDIYSVKYLYSDFKKKNGYHRSIELSKMYHLYRQDYCGCIYSKRERLLKSNIQGE